MREFGAGEEFRRPGLLERAGRPFRHCLIDSRVREPLKRLYERILETFQPGRLVSRFPHGERVRLAAAYRQVVWNPQEYEAFRADVPAGSTVLDVGANLGGYTMLLAQWVGPSGRVHAFEPAPAARAGLLRHAALNGVADRVVVHAEAVAAAPGTARFRAAGVQGDNRLAADGDPQGLDVETTSLDEFCRSSGISPAFIKVDVEGAELDLLRGARRTIASAGADLRLYMEIHPDLWPAFGYTREDLEAELRVQGLRAERLDGGADPWTLRGVCLRLRPCGS